MPTDMSCPGLPVRDTSQTADAGKSGNHAERLLPGFTRTQRPDHFRLLPYHEGRVVNDPLNPPGEPDVGRMRQCCESSPQNLRMWKVEQTPTLSMNGATLPHWLSATPGLIGVPCPMPSTTNVSTSTLPLSSLYCL